MGATEQNASATVRQQTEGSSSTTCKLSLDTFKDIFQNIEPDVQIDTLELAQGSGRGDNYTSTLYRIQLHGQRRTTHADGKKIKWEKSLICKIMPENTKRREAYKSDKLFHNEVKFYNTIMPELLSFQASKTTENATFNALPKCYFARDDLLVMEDLRLRGFQMPDRVKGLSLEEMQSVLLQVAQFHALSLAYKYEHPKKFTQLRCSVNEGLFCAENTSWYKNYYDNLTKNAIKMVTDTLPASEDHNKKYLNAICEFAESTTFFGTMVHIASDESKLSALCHGDCWVNNFLYRYDITNGTHENGHNVSVLEVALVDFQLIRYCSIALDVATLLYCCTSKEMRDAHLDSLLKCYTCEVFKWLKLLCTELPDYCKTLEAFEALFDKELKMYGRFALGIAMDIIPISTCSSEEAPDLYLACNDDVVQELGAPELHIPTNELCRKKMTDIVIDMVDAKLL